MEGLDTGNPYNEKIPTEKLGRLRLTRRVTDAPDAHQVATALVEILSEVDHLQRCQRPREFVVVAGLIEDWRNSAVEPVLLKREEKFPLDPP